MPAKPQATIKTRRSPGRPKLENVSAIQGKLFSVALELFLKNGYGATSLNQIVKAAAVSKTTLYSRYDSKEQLFRALMHEQVKSLAASGTTSPLANHASLEGGLKDYANRMLEVSLQGDLLEVNRLIYSESGRFPELGAAATERTEIGIEQIAEFIRQRAAADRVSCSDPRGVAEAFILMIRGWYVDVTLTNRKVSAAKRQQFVDRAVHALLSARGDW
jgi:TetR/AcrR family transcriptional repressor of mexJK operon